MNLPLCRAVCRHGECRTRSAAVLPASGPAECHSTASCASCGGCRAQVAQFKATVLLLPNGSDRVTSAPVQPWESDKKVEDEEVLKLLATSLKKSKSSKKTAKKKARTVAHGRSCQLRNTVVLYLPAFEAALSTSACPEPDAVARSA